MVYVDLEFPLRIPSSANMREHWAAKHQRIAKQRADVRVLLRSEAGGWHKELKPLTITITRIAMRFFDGDNWQNACKGVRDEIAAWLNTKDNDPLLTWEYRQKRGKPKEFAFGIRIEDTAEGAVYQNT